MKEKSYLGFLFSAIQQNHSSLLLHAQYAGLGLVLHWAGHSAVEMLMQEQGPLCSIGQKGRLHLQLPLLLSVELWAETSCSHLYSCSPCCHCGDSCSTLVQIRLKHIVCFGRQAESTAQSPRTGKGLQRMSFGEGFSRAGRHVMAYPLARLPREAEQHIHSRPRYRSFWRVKPPNSFTPPVCFLVQQGIDADPLWCFCTADFFAMALHGSLKLLYSSIKLGNKSYCSKVKLWSL